MDPQTEGPVLYVKGKNNAYSGWHQVKRTSTVGGVTSYETGCGLHFFAIEVRSSPHGQGPKCRFCTNPPLAADWRNGADRPSRMVAAHA